MEERAVLGVRAKVARTFRERARGLIGRPPPPPGEGLLILRCNAIHTFIMGYPIDAFVGRCGGTHSQPSGVIRVDQNVYDDAVKGLDGSEHPAKLGVMLAWKFAEEFGKSAFTLNSTNVDELNDYARLTGIKGVYRFAHTHCLNQKAVAQFHAEKTGRRYEDCNTIAATAVQAAEAH